MQDFYFTPLNSPSATDTRDGSASDSKITVCDDTDLVKPVEHMTSQR